jgi:hypothetical protein
MKIKVQFTNTTNMVQQCDGEPAKYKMIDRKFMLNPLWQQFFVPLVVVNFYEVVGNNKVRVLVGPTTKLCDIGSPLDAELIDHDKCVIL